MGSGRRWTLPVAGLLAISALSGCTRSMPISYQPSLYRLPQADQLKGIGLGVAKLEDRRTLIERSNPESLSYVMRSGAWRFGLTYQNQEYVPVADLVQTLFVDEFARAGVETKAVPKILTRENPADMRAAGEQAGMAYVLGGSLLLFEIVNATNGWVVTSRRGITLAISLVRVRDGSVVLDKIVSTSDQEESAAGAPVRSFDRLMNSVFRRVVTQIVEEVSAKLALGASDVDTRVTALPR